MAAADYQHFTAARPETVFAALIKALPPLNGHVHSVEALRHLRDVLLVADSPHDACQMRASVAPVRVRARWCRSPAPSPSTRWAARDPPAPPGAGPALRRGRPQGRGAVPPNGRARGRRPGHPIRVNGPAPADVIASPGAAATGRCRRARGGPMPTYAMRHRLGAEFLGTFWLVFAGCGSAVIASSFTNETNFPLGIGFLGVALAFGLTVMTMAYAVGHISGGHFNPAVSIGLASAVASPGATCRPYVVDAGRGRHRRGAALLGHRQRQGRLQRQGAASRPTGTATARRATTTSRPASSPRSCMTAFFLLHHPRRDRHPAPRGASPRSRSASA